MGNSNCDACGNDKKACICPKDIYVAQVGGDHYHAEYQHWDWIVDIKMGYLEGCATKYVSRWWKKNGVQDLEKARTYIEKLLANYDRMMNLSLQLSNEVRRKYTTRFIEVNKLPNMEADICELLANWKGKYDLQTCLSVMDGLVTTAKQAPQGHPRATPANPPPTQSHDAVDAAYGAGQGITGQGTATNASANVADSLAMRSFGPCSCGCGLARAKNMVYATPECEFRKERGLIGLEHPFGYDSKLDD
jgi:hypothetical protein